MRSGLDLSSFGDFDWEVSGVALAQTGHHSRFNPSHRGRSPPVLVLLLVLITAIYPAWRASKLEPARAMRTFQ